MRPIQKILVPVDFSETSREAVLLAADFSRKLGASVTLAYVHENLTVAFPDGYAFYMPGQLERLYAAYDKELEAEKRAAETAGALGVQTRRLEGTASRALVDLAKDEQFDLIVMGTHGRTGIQHALLGSVAERVMRQAPCPVLTVKVPSSKAGSAEARTSQPSARH